MSYEGMCGRCGWRGPLMASHTCMEDVLEQLKIVSSLLREFMAAEKAKGVIPVHSQEENEA